jgi:hypothetical protein
MKYVKNSCSPQSKKDFLSFSNILKDLLGWRTKLIFFCDIENLEIGLYYEINFENNLQYVTKLFETNRENFSGSKLIIGGSITFNPEKLDLVVLEQFFYIL